MCYFSITIEGETVTKCENPPSNTQQIPSSGHKPTQSPAASQTSPVFIKPITESFSVGTEFQIRLTFGDTEQNIYWFQVKPESIQPSNEILTSLLAAEKFDSECVNSNDGDFGLSECVVVKSPEYGNWYRACITGKVDTDYTVVYVDYGNFETVKIVKDIPGKYKDVPALVFKYCPKDTVTQDMVYDCLKSAIVSLGQQSSLSIYFCNPSTPFLCKGRP